MNILTGYISATSGTVTVGGYDIMDSPKEAKRLIGYLPEQPPLYYDMTVNEYLRFICDLKNVPLRQRKRQLDVILYLVKIGDMKDRLIKNLSIQTKSWCCAGTRRKSASARIRRAYRRIGP